MDQLPRLGKRELICLLSFTCNYVVFVLRGFLFLWVLGMDCGILLWHSLSLPYNYFLSFLLTSHKLIQLFIPIDCTRQIRSFVKNDLLLATKVIIYVNRNYVNLAVKFRYPNYMEFRPLKCCIGPKLTPRA